MEISGLEDEFRLSSGKSRLIYVKKSEDRSPELVKLLKDIQDADSITYQRFTTPDEFRELLENDLAVLLSERFESVQTQQASLKNNKAFHLPVLRSELIGRETELKQIKEILFQHDTGLLTLTGSGGTGKSRLALELAHSIAEKFQDGVYFVSLASIAEASLVVPTIAHAIGLLDTGQQPIQETLIEFLLDKHVLLILDNFEHVIDAGVSIAYVLSRCHQIKLLITSRTPLRIRDERIFQVAPLNVPMPGEVVAELADASPCVRLFVERAREVNPSIQFPYESLLAIGDICRKVDGLPLAVELAAARVKLLSPTALLSRMGQSLDILSHGPRDLPERHQTLRATIAWSYNLLDEESAYFFRHLSIFSDGWTLEASDAIINAAGVQLDVLDYTDRLLNAGLVKSMDRKGVDNAEPRFTMLQTIKEYATEVLRQKGEAPAIQLRHAVYYSNLLEEAQDSLWNGDPIPWLERLDEEYQNITVAFFSFLAAGNTDQTWKIFGSLVHYWSSRGRFGEAFNWMQLAGIHIDAQPPAEQVSIAHQAKGILASGVLSFFAGRFMEAYRLLEKCIPLCEQENLWKEIARAKTYIGAAGISLGNADAVARVEETIALGERIKDEFSYVISSAFLGDLHTTAGDYKKAIFFIKQAEEHSRRSPQIVLLAVSLLQKSGYYLMQDEYPRAIEAGNESLKAFERCGFKSMEGWAQNVLGQSYLMARQLTDARSHFANGIARGRESGDKSMVLFGILGLGSIAFLENHFQRAAILLGAVDTMIRMTGYAFWSSDKKLYHWLMEQLTEKMSDEELKEYRMQGEILSQEKAISLALAEEG